MSAAVTAETPVIEEKWEIEKLLKCHEYTCPHCENVTKFHPNYLKNQAVGCIKCENIKDVCMKMLKCRNYELVSIEKKPGKDNDYVITFKCPLSHIYKQTWKVFRKGRGCFKCNRKTRKTVKIENAVKEECNCKELKKGKQTRGGYICEHYNFAIICPEPFKSWCFDLNKDIDPYKISPASHKKAFFKCERYNQTYPQGLYSIYAGRGCPFCFGKAVCVENSLYTTHPEIAKKWHPDNETKPWEFLSGSGKKVWWKCENKECENKYEATIRSQAKDKQSCPKCAPGYAQRTGGHAHFIKVAREIHKDKYEYPEQMINMITPININCPVISPITGAVHGLFSQIPANHREGNGCPKCAKERNDSIGVTKIKEILTKWGFHIDIHYFNEHKIPGLIYKKLLRLDFYIKENICQNLYPIAIEFDHEQHFKHPKAGWCNSIITRKRDLHKDLFCIKNKISVIRIPHTHTITEIYLAKLINRCQSDKLCYFSYRHYEREILKKIDLTGI